MIFLLKFMNFKPDTPALFAPTNRFHGVSGFIFGR